MIRNISTGIDIGSRTTRVVVGEFFKGEKYPKIIGFGEGETAGVRHGYVTNIREAEQSLRKSLAMAEKSSGIKIKRAYVSIGGSTLRGEMSSGTGIISKADGEVTALDINKALEDCEDNLNLNNKKVIKVFPISFKLDGKEIPGRPEGMRGTKLEVKALFVNCFNSHFEDLMETVTKAGIEPVDVIIGGEAGSFLSMSQKQKIVGGALVDIGAETVSLSVYENGILNSFYTFNIGGEDITNDIAIGMKVSLENAERLKLGDSEEYPKKKLDEIIEARLSDIFELIENHLKKIKRSELLPAGITFSGGGANLPQLEEFSKRALRLPSRIATSEFFGNAKTKLRDPSWFTALGLVMSPKHEDNVYITGTLSTAFKNLKNILKSNLKQLMP